MTSPRRRALATLVLLAALFVLPAPVRADPLPLLHYVALGDSITHGSYGVDPVGAAWRAQFDSRVASATGATPASTVLAIGGWSTADVLPQLAAALLDAEHRQHIDLVIVMLGTNDAVGSIPDAEWRYARLLTTILDGTPTSTRVALAFVQYSVPPASSALIAGEHLMDDAIFRCGAARAWTTATPGPRFAGWINPNSSPPQLSVDGVHPNAAGYIALGDLVYAGVRATYGWPALP